MSYAKHLESLKNTVAEKRAEMSAIAEKSISESRSMDNAEQEQFDTIGEEIKRLEGDIARFKQLVDADKQTLEPVVDAKKSEPAVVGNNSHLNLKKTEKTEKGIGFARLARVQALAEMKKGTSAINIAQNLYPNDGALHDAIAKGAVGAANLGTQAWAGDLRLDGGAFADFVEYLRPRTVVGQISDKLRKLPFNTPVLIQTSKGTAQWVKEGSAKPLTKWAYEKTELRPLKVAAIAAVTKETLNQSTAAVDNLIRDELARSIGAAMDETFVSGDIGVDGEKPAGLLYGATDVTSELGGGSGGVETVRCDLAAMLKQLVGNNFTTRGAFFLMSERTAIDLSFATNLAGAPAFPDITNEGGTLMGIPVFTSEYIEDSSNGALVILAKGDEIYLGDEGGIDVSVSTEASLLMADNPSMNSTTPTGSSSLVSLWQTNSVGFLVERFISWKLRNADAVVYGNVNWDCSQ